MVEAAGDPTPVTSELRRYRDGVDALQGVQRKGPASVRVQRSVRRGAVPGMLHLTPAERASDEVVLWLHGGSFVAGSVRSHERIAARMAAELGREVALVDYRLAPEHTFPAALDDACAAVDHTRAVAPIILGGDSAGGAIATTVARELEKPARGLLLAYLLLDLRLCWQPPGPSQERARLRDFIELYRGAHPVDDPLLSPASGKLPEVDVIAVAAAADDPLRTEALRLASDASAAGRVVASWVEPGTRHAFLVHDEPSRAVDATLTRFGHALAMRGSR